MFPTTGMHCGPQQVCKARDLKSELVVPAARAGDKTRATVHSFIAAHRAYKNHALQSINSDFAPTTERLKNPSLGGTTRGADACMAIDPLDLW
jgi:hypothetical protein